MRSKRQIVRTHRRLRADGVAGSILLPDHGREQEEDGGEGETGESEDVQQWEVRGQACGCAALNVEVGLWVEGEGPAEGVDPAEESI